MIVANIIRNKTNNKMKSKIKIMAATAIIATGFLAGISGFQTTKSSAITLANVEALTRWEVTIEYDKCCEESLHDICVPNYMGIILGRPVKC